MYRNARSEWSVSTQLVELVGLSWILTEGWWLVSLVTDQPLVKLTLGCTLDSGGHQYYCQNS